MLGGKLSRGDLPPARFAKIEALFQILSVEQQSTRLAPVVESNAVSF